MCSLAKKGVPPKDKRARHGNRPHKFTDEVRDSIIQHVSSFRARKSHYSSGQKQYVYLHEDLNVEKMQRLYKDAHPTNKVSLSSYKKVFYYNFNTSLGYPRCDTCSTCDEYIVKCKEIQQHLYEIFYCDNYNGKFQSCTVRKRIPKNCTQQHTELQPLYNGALAINTKKYNDIQSLVRFCSRKSADYFANLCHVNHDGTD